MNWLVLLPFLILTAAVVAGMFAATAFRKHAITASVAAVGVLAAFVSLFAIPAAPSRAATSLLVLDNLALFYFGLLLVGSLLITGMAYGYFCKKTERPDEFYVLMLMAVLGSSILVAATHFASFILGLEILTVSLYAMIAYTRDARNGVEAGIKYLILAAGSAAFLLFGMALAYAETGSMQFAAFAEVDAASPLIMLALALMVVGIGFKLALFPFHMWTPDVYQGAPAPAAAFIASVSKGGVFVILLRFFGYMDVHNRPTLMWAFVAIAVASMFAGNLLALMQINVKRILVYSSIANLGYLLVAFIASGALAASAAAFYLTAYFAAVIGAFGIVARMSTTERDADTLEDYQGLYWRNPWLAAAFTVMMLSLAGIPLTAGFIGKFYIMAAGGEDARWLLLGAVIINSAIGLYYYLRVIVAMCAEQLVDGPSSAQGKKSEAIVLAVLTAVVVILGVYPAPILAMIAFLASYT